MPCPAFEPKDWALGLRPKGPDPGFNVSFLLENQTKPKDTRHNFEQFGGGFVTRSPHQRPGLGDLSPEQGARCPVPSVWAQGLSLGFATQGPGLKIVLTFHFCWKIKPNRKIREIILSNLVVAFAEISPPASESRGSEPRAGGRVSRAQRLGPGTGPWVCDPRTRTQNSFISCLLENQTKPKDTRHKFEQFGGGFVPRSPHSDCFL